jgi:carboxypeptidase Taq
MLLNSIVLTRGYIVPRSIAVSSILFKKTMSSSVCQATASVSSSELQSSSSIDAYSTVLSKLQIITQLQRVKSILSYDQLVFMPKNASADRGAQMSALAALLHEKTTDPSLKDALQLARNEMIDSKDTDALRLLEIEQKKLEENERLSTDLVAKVASLESSAYTAWVTAKSNNDFASFSPILKECFDTAMEVSAAKRGDSNISLYTKMLDDFETGMSQDRIDEIFGEIRSAIVPLIAQVLESKHKPSTDALSGSFDIDTQKAFCEQVVTKMGYDIQAGRIDVSVHPFTMSFSPNDVRITSRYRNDGWYQGLAAMIHESGHAMYEQNLGRSATSLDTALSMGTHESQSLFWERHVGLSLPFWNWVTPLLKEKFPEQFDSFSAHDIYGAVNTVSPSLIRVEADELTYPLHVILRYEIEKDVIGGKLEVQDIPERWKRDMKAFLNVDVPDDGKGCLQDIHWASLAFGYFPTYLIGSATAAQLDHYCRQDLPMDEMIEKGEFEEIKNWLTRKVHQHGKRYKSLDALLEDQVGEKLNPQYFINYLDEKYKSLYHLETIQDTLIQNVVSN